MSTHNMFLWRKKQNYPLVITKYPPYLFHWLSTHIVVTEVNSFKKCIKNSISQYMYIKRNFSLSETVLKQ